MTWSTPTAEQRAERDERILELWALGETRQEIARRFDLTPERISQIVNGHGKGWR